MIFLAAALLCGCAGENAVVYRPETDLDRLARIFSELPMGTEQVEEVHDAVSASCGNGYDDEYLLRDLLSEPGTGVGERRTRAAGQGKPKEYGLPLKEMLRAYLEAGDTRSGGAEAYLSALSASDIQIYWPYSDQWDGRTLPVLTFDPENESSSNIGYLPAADGSGLRMREVEVNEEVAARRPVWVINRNDDSGFTTLELHRKLDPSWGTGGGVIVVDGGAAVSGGGMAVPKTAALEEGFKTVVLQDFRALRNYDSWFAGASEFFIKCGAVEDFSASTEAELQLYSPSVTDFMVVVRRREVDSVKTLNTVLIADMSPRLERFALLLNEDDGGKVEKWECDAVVKVKSKSYGFSISLPYRERDDIVWRGSITDRFLSRYDHVPVRFGDVELTFRVLDQVPDGILPVPPEEAG